MPHFERDSLVRALIELRNKLAPIRIPIIIGGGMGLFLRQESAGEGRQPRYPVVPQLRSTNDLDVFLSAELIVDAAKIHQLRDSLTELGYKAKENARYFQFAREINWNEQRREVKIDLLAPIPEDPATVTITAIRVRPRDAKRIHARVVKEAAGIEYGKEELDLRGFDASLPEKSGVFVPSRFNYLILKLHAFHDRYEDVEVDFGRHHAYDIFATVVSMTEADWVIAREHLQAEKEKSYLQSARNYQKKYFSKEMSLGVIRLKENRGYQDYGEEFDRYIPDFIGDMDVLFTP